MLPPSLFASRSVVGANLFTALLYGPFTVMLTLIPFVMIRGAHLVAGLAFIVSSRRSPTCSAAGSADACHCSPAAPSSPWDAP